MALPKDMRLKGHRTFNYIHKNSITYHGKLMTFKVAKSNPAILLTHKFTNTSNNFRIAIAISKKVSKKAVERKTGARGLRSILEESLLDTMYELPSLDNVSKVVVDEASVSGESKPLVIFENSNPAKAVSD